MLIGIDVDDTLCNTTESLINYAEEYDNTIEKITNKKNHLGFFWTDEQKNFFYDTYYDLAIKNALPYPHAKEVIDELRYLNNKFAIISARNQNRKNATIEWLARNKIIVDKIILTCYKDYAAMMLGVSTFIDDSIKNCEDVESKGIKTYIYTAHKNIKYYNKNIKRVNNWDEIYKEITRNTCN